ncbi:DUF1292 domain-containing protein [Peptoniphilus sp. KCTC 25270]|uniref:DUF1292 domain-containing protein n=1 Tax=Peptoniphilus sp. KCTC 25270 TaxID=2897414 RepID=UPI001E30F9AE|nr:DUF1292 domain-containing protein [Peptoniphilus sp. KCTC 25270]MCD1146955.1 DUF1292 domain-containing protein [Peptoniphilus sp. KCTC 25270]
MTDTKHNENCGCGEHEHEEVQTIVLTLEDDSELECLVIGVFDFEGKEYIAMTPDFEGEEEAEILIYEFKELDEEEIELNFIESEEVFNRVAEEFDRIYSDENLD